MRRACGFAWDHHVCARPPGHPGEHDCWCGTYRGQPEDAASASMHAREAAS